MKILFVCAGGMSTGLIVQKMERWAKEKGVDLSVKATGVLGWESNWKNYECILVGPQIRYLESKIKEGVEIPVSVIDTRDYGMQKIENILSLAYKITGQSIPE